MIRASIQRNGTEYVITVHRGTEIVEAEAYDYIPLRVAKEYAESQLHRLDKSATLGEWEASVSSSGAKMWTIGQA